MTVILQGNKGHFHFSMDVAKEVGVDGAVFLENICFWMRSNAGNRRNLHDGRYWTYNKLDAFVELFPCWSRRQIERIINNLVDDGYLLTGNFNKSQYDRTIWYTLSDSGLKLFNISYETQEPCISPNGEIEIPEWGNRNPQTVTAIPDNKPDNKPDRERQDLKPPLSISSLNDFQPSEMAKDIARDWGLDIELELIKFRSNIISKSKNKQKLDFSSEFDMWMLRSYEYIQKSLKRNKKCTMST